MPVIRPLHLLSRLLATGLFCAAVHAASPAITLTVDPDAPGKAIPPLFAGLSMETEVVLPDAAGNRYLSPGNTGLVRLFRLLGVSHLRIGGNSVDDHTKTPSPVDIDELFAFAKSAGVHVAYSVRLKDGAPSESARIAAHIADRYADLSDGITIGNEADQYLHGTEAYLKAVTPHFKAVTQAAPGIRVNGPGIHLAPEYLTAFAKAFGPTGKVGYVGAHAYFGWCAYGSVGEGEAKVPVVRDPAALRAEMLSPAWEAEYAKFHDAFAPTLAKWKLPYRIDETNSYYIGGAPGASDSTVAAVWALDYLYRWASLDAAGIDFHTGTTLFFPKGKVPGGLTRKPCNYAAFWALPEGGYAVQAVGYGIKAFDLGGHGDLLPVRAEAPEGARVAAYAVRAVDGRVFVTLVNKAIGGAPATVTLKRSGGARFAKAESMALRAPGDNPAATAGFTLGGAAIADDASWKGEWSPVPAGAEDIAVTVPPASALILRLSR